MTTEPVSRTCLESIDQLLADVGGVGSPVPRDGAEARLMSAGNLRSGRDAHELFVLNLVLMVRVLETFFGLLNDFNYNFLYGFVEALNNHIILLELVVDLEANPFEITVDIIAKAASTVPQVNVFTLLRLEEWVSRHQ